MDLAGGKSPVQPERMDWSILASACASVRSLRKLSCRETAVGVKGRLISFLNWHHSCHEVKNAVDLCGKSVGRFIVRVDDGYFRRGVKKRVK